jgi:hypothetical protein
MTCSHLLFVTRQFQTLLQATFNHQIQFICGRCNGRQYDMCVERVISCRQIMVRGFLMFRLQIHIQNQEVAEAFITSPIELLLLLSHDTTPA